MFSHFKKEVGKKKIKLLAVFLYEEDWEEAQTSDSAGSGLASPWPAQSAFFWLKNKTKNQKVKLIWEKVFVKVHTTKLWGSLQRHLDPGTWTLSDSFFLSTSPTNPLFPESTDCAPYNWFHSLRPSVPMSSVHGHTEY